jgi:hypothetical protein
MIYRASLILLFAACGSDASTSADAASAVAACQSVGTSFCERMYACYTAAEIAGFQLPTTQAECVTQENANCTMATPEPGYCKGTAQTSATAATMCSAELTALTCDQLKQPASGVCKTDLCVTN